MTTSAFDDRQIHWQAIDNIEHLHYRILDIDRERQIIDVLFRLSARQQILLHRHVAQNNMLVIEGEHRIYDADGNLREMRPTGCYTSSPPSPTPHREGGGDSDAIVFFSIRDPGPVFYEILDDNLHVVATLEWKDFENLLTAQTQNTGQGGAVESE